MIFNSRRVSFDMKIIDDVIRCTGDGILYVSDFSEDLFEESKDVVASVLSKVDGKAVEDWGIVKTAVRKELGGFLYRMTKRRPMIIVMIVPN